MVELPVLFLFAAAVVGGYVAVSAQMLFIYFSLWRTKVSSSHRRVLLFLTGIALALALYLGHTVFGQGVYPTTFWQAVGWSLNVVGITSLSIVANLIERQVVTLEIVEGTMGDGINS